MSCCALAASSSSVRCGDKLREGAVLALKLHLRLNAKTTMASLAKNLYASSSHDRTCGLFAPTKHARACHNQRRPISYGLISGSSRGWACCRPWGWTCCCHVNCISSRHERALVIIGGDGGTVAHLMMLVHLAHHAHGHQVPPGRALRRAVLQERVQMQKDPLVVTHLHPRGVPDIGRKEVHSVLARCVRVVVSEGARRRSSFPSSAALCSAPRRPRTRAHAGRRRARSLSAVRKTATHAATERTSPLRYRLVSR